jgi:glycosyltransferase involved in cell wall biosynthesis
VLYSPYDPDGLADMLEKVLLSPESAAQMGRVGREAVCREFSAERMGREFAAVCEAVTARV